MTWWDGLRCNVLGWHRPDFVLYGWDGVSFTSNCVRCRRRLLMDSNGNWFAAWGRK